ncbi:glycine--tRNA ligase subunit beta [Candidatus Kirkpatrickella diaphorinae]|uniref:Glycine--tRNA ligase beta subunit n=1 Tax=Candidatus Kirkpatrickella diaphorinae TaxID=2984322 RepID=A0ABY6GLA8_9PROT|nr:glycine--tRNA ligase subunit beta [Candidatus Kirkpatrickella diaphorinae]UYH51538.1 glycine--tRNA ligase subunit beta [Candidatus Kirkpatrickella diaphorinae]
MAEFLLALESEEIPAAMQQPAAEALAQALEQHLSALKPFDLKPFWGPRRIGLAVTIDATVPASTQSERGPRVTAPEQALMGFLRKHDAKKSDLQEEKGFWVLNREIAERSAASFLQDIVPEILWNFTWPKSMRWGNGSAFTWVRPLRRIIAVLDGDIVPFTLARGDDDGHELTSGNLSQGHRFLAPKLFAVSSYEGYREGLRERKVILEADARREAIRKDIDVALASQNLRIVEDEGLLNEVVGLSEWPVPMLGKIDARFMELPNEVRQVSMRTHQRYFATRYDGGSIAPYFLFLANQEFPDGGAATTAGNERVLRARFADAWHFWELDRKVTLESRLGALDNVTFHKKLGSVGDRVKRLVKLSGFIAQELGLTDAEKRNAERAALLAKADLTTGMVGEFPELQGIMGGYYAEHDGEPSDVAAAIRSQYLSCANGEEDIPSNAAIALTLADRFDILVGFFAIGEMPTGSGDPFALRRAALGIIRIIDEAELTLVLEDVFARALALQPVNADHSAVSQKLSKFMADRVRVQLRNDNVAQDIIAAVMSKAKDNDIRDLKKRVEALRIISANGDGPRLVAASKRAANILHIENQKDGPHTGEPDEGFFVDLSEQALFKALETANPEIAQLMKREEFIPAMEVAATLRAPLDQFFEAVKVNDPDPARRINRLRLLNRVNEVLSQIADFSQIQG